MIELEHVSGSHHVVLTVSYCFYIFCTFDRIFSGSLKQDQVPGSPNDTAKPDFASIAKSLPKSSRVPVLQTLKR